MREDLSKRRLLLVAQRPSDFVEMRRCAQAFHALGWPCIILYFGQGAQDSEIVAIEAELSGLRAQGTLEDYVLLRTLAPSRAKSAKSSRCGLVRSSLKGRHRLLHRVVSKVDVWIGGVSRRLVAKALAIVRRSLQQAVNGGRILRSFFDELHSIRKLLVDTKPELIVLPEDVVGLVCPLVVKAGHLQNIPSIIIPYTIANQQEAFKSLRVNPMYRGSHWANWIAAVLFPKWRMTQDGATLVRLPAPYILGQELTSTSPPDPWMMNSGFANAIAIENEAMLDYYLAAGLPRSKMHLVGAIYDDHLATLKSDRPAQLQRLREELNITNDKPLLLVGGCPDQSASCPPGFEFPSMDDFVRRLSTKLKEMDTQYQVVLRPHPNFHRMAELAAEHGVLCATIDTARLVALSDVYLAFGSATIRWAISCCVPVINYDVFHYNYSDFKDVSGVTHVESFAELARVFSRLLSGPDYLRELVREISISAGRWGRLDGKSTERIALLVNQICDAQPIPRTSK